MKNFKEVNDYLQKLFSAIDFFKIAKTEGGLHSYRQAVDECSNGAIISISYPGYKARDGKSYDYRVNLSRGDINTSLSHVNIVIDIYNKICYNGINVQDLFDALFEFIKDGNIDVIQNIKYAPAAAPSDKLISRALNGHPNDEKRKTYNRAGNSVDWSLEELFICIKWISVQEDINYPWGLGRKMSFLRYLEAIYVSTDDKYTLEKVIDRTLAHYIPDDWAGIDKKVFD